MPAILPLAGIVVGLNAVLGAVRQFVFDEPLAVPDIGQGCCGWLWSMRCSCRSPPACNGASSWVPRYVSASPFSARNGWCWAALQSLEHAEDAIEIIGSDADAVVGDLDQPVLFDAGRADRDHRGTVGAAPDLPGVLPVLPFFCVLATIPFIGRDMGAGSSNAKMPYSQFGDMGLQPFLREAAKRMARQSG